MENNRKFNYTNKSRFPVRPSALIGMSEVFFFMRATVINLQVTITIPYTWMLVLVMDMGIIVPLVLHSICWPSKIVKYDTLFLIAFNCLFFACTLWICPSYSTLFFDGVSANGGNMNIYDKIFNFSCSVFLAYVLLRADDDNAHLIRTIRIIGWIKFLLLFWHVFLTIDDYMLFGYDIELAAILLLCSYILTKKRVDLCCSIVAIGEGVVYGNRGCLLGYLVVVIFYVYFMQKKITFSKILLIMTAFVGYVALTSETIVSALMLYLNGRGSSSRTLELFISGGFLIDSARINIWTKCIEAIKNHSILWGYGAYGDRAVLWGGLYYAHNLILEIFLTFGIVFGILIIAIVIYYLIKGFKNTDYAGKIIIISFAGYSITKLMISNSFWYEPTLFALIGFCVRESKKLDE